MIASYKCAYLLNKTLQVGFSNFVKVLLFFLLPEVTVVLEIIFDVCKMFHVHIYQVEIPSDDELTTPTTFIYYTFEKNKWGDACILSYERVTLLFQYPLRVFILWWHFPLI